MRIQRNTLQIVLGVAAVLVLMVALWAVLQFVSDDGGREIAGEGETGVADFGPAADEPGVGSAAVDEPIVIVADPSSDGAGRTRPDPFESGTGEEPAYAQADAAAFWDRIYGGGSAEETPLRTTTPPADPDAPAVEVDVEETPRTSLGPIGDVPGVSSQPPASPAGGGTYEIKSNDSFYTIARDQLGDASLYPLLERANPDVDPRRLRPGTTIVLPDRSSADAGTSGRRSTPVEVARSIDPDSQHVVAAGETLSGISLQRYGRSIFWHDIHVANRAVIGDDPGRLAVGMVLDLPQLPEGSLGSE